MGRYNVENYCPNMTIRETEVAIKAIKDYFEVEIARVLDLTRVSAPLFVFPETGLNDNLNGVERPVSFGILEQGDKPAEIVHSLAKWKRYALKKYGFSEGEGLYTDMNAIRRDELTDAIHSIYVDQWDWELCINSSWRNTDYLAKIVNTIYSVLKNIDKFCAQRFGVSEKLPQEIRFVTTQELEDLYPESTPKEREDLITRQHGAVFLMQIGGQLNSGGKHDGRAPDYDDWSLNGDILFHYPLFDCALEVSSMGIRVDSARLLEQLKLANCEDRALLPFQKSLIDGELPECVGGGIGQSRLCMFFLEKAHIGEVQSSLWPDATITECAEKGINLL